MQLLFDCESKSFESPSAGKRGQVAGLLIIANAPRPFLGKGVLCSLAFSLSLCRGLDTSLAGARSC